MKKISSETLESLLLDELEYYSKSSSKFSWIEKDMGPIIYTIIDKASHLLLHRTIIIDSQDEDECDIRFFFENYIGEKFIGFISKGERTLNYFQCKASDEDWRNYIEDSIDASKNLLPSALIKITDEKIKNTITP